MPDKTQEDLDLEKDAKKTKTTVTSLEARVADLEKKLAELDSLRFLVDHATQINRFFGHGAV